MTVKRPNSDSAASRYRLYHELQVAAHELQKLADRALSEVGDLTTAQAAVLAAINQAGAPSQKAVASQLKFNESAMTAMTRRLLDAELIQRMPDVDDKRAWCLTLTDKGRTALEACRAPFDVINATIDQVLSGEEVAKLVDFLKRLIHASRKV